MDHHELSDQQNLAEILPLFRVGMMTTISSDGTLKSRPMMSQRIPFDGVLWFFLSSISTEAEQRKYDGPINVSYSLPQSEQYLSVSGKATLVFDRQKIDELWNSDFEPWFPKGLQDPHLKLLRIQVESWGYWDSSYTALTQLHEKVQHPDGKFVEQYDDHKRADLSSAWVNQDVGTPRTRKEGEKLAEES